MAVKVKTVKADAFDTLSPKKYILIRGARVHNLKNISVAIKRGDFTVITGLSGSGKSSLAFDTLFAEGQRRYVESLSSYARQFLGRLDKPDVDSIIGISPAVAIEQKVTSRTSRSTVGTTTEIYDYIKLMYARIGKTFSPISGQEVKRHRSQDVLQFILNHPPSTRFLILADIPPTKDIRKKLDMLIQQGFARVMFQEEVYAIEDIAPRAKSKDSFSIVIDRITADPTEENQTRMIDSIESAFFEGQGECILYDFDTKKRHVFNNRFEADGMTFEEPSVNLFTFNNPVGACRTCEGFGSVIGIDPELVIPNKQLSVYQEAIVPWRGEVMSEWKNQLVMNAAKFNFPIHKPIADLTAEQRKLLWTGNSHFSGLNKFFAFIESESYKIQYRVMLSRYRGKTECPECHGTRLRHDANYVKVGGKSISELVQLSIAECAAFFDQLTLEPQEAQIAKRLLTEVRNRLNYLNRVGLEYLTLNRLSNTLSGGESQRIHLATSLGSSLVGSIYILDEPSIGLHPRDTDKLIGVLKELKSQGNTVIVVEHDEEIMRAADNLIDMGPEAGTNGGHIVFNGSTDELIKNASTLTAQYLRNERSASRQAQRKIGNDKLILRGAREHTLKNLTVEFPLHCLVVVSGVSGSGKSTLIRDILYPALLRELGGIPTDRVGEYDALEGDIRTIKMVEFVDQNPIGKSSRSNPVTYIKAYDDIRQLYANQTLSRQRGYKPAHFSFNVEGGRCEACEGEGFQTISMQFMADIKLPCDVCKGNRFKEEITEVKYRQKSISDILNMTVDNAIEFFSSDSQLTLAKNIVERLKPLQDVGLGYIGMGQSSSSLSGGEAQRVKLASFLGKGAHNQHTVFIFDEPTTGLHFHDVKKLMDSFDALLAKGHSIITIEHNPDVIHSADWLIELGPEGGSNGGQIVYQGKPDGIRKIKNSYTAQYLFSNKS